MYDYVVRTTIHLPDDLAEQAKAAGINVSGVCQDALRRELKMIETMQETSRVRVVRDDRTVEFEGKEVAYDRHEEVTYYVTAKGAIAVYDHGDQKLQVYDDFEGLAETVADPREETSEALQMVALAVGADYVEFLDI